MSEDSQSEKEPPLLQTPRSKTVAYVDSKESMTELLSALAQSDLPISVDAERASGFKYSQRAYLLQIRTSDDSIWLVDTFAISPDNDAEDFRELAAAIGSRTWIFHAASQDLPCVRALGLEPTQIVDTELGARILGLPKVGLGAITEQFVGFRLAKEHSAVDWSKRPLDPGWLNYAALDVDVLPDLWTAIENELTHSDKLEIALQEFEHVLKAKPKPAKEERWRSLSGLHSIKDRQKLAIAKALWQAREELAVKLDVSPGRLVPDSSLTWLASSDLRSKSELAGSKEFHGRATRTYLDTWWASYSHGQKTRDLPELKPKREGIPNHRIWPSKFPEAADRLDRARSELAKISQELNIPVENVLNPEALRVACFNSENVENEFAFGQSLRSQSVREWQIQAVTQRLFAAIHAQK